MYWLARTKTKKLDDVADGQFKQVIVVRSDLKMSKGKIAVQVGHAAVSAAEEARRSHKAWWKGWIDEGQRKIAVKAGSERDILKLKERATRSRLPTALIVDRGLTELPPGTTTCLGIGPAPATQIDTITRKLKLV